MGLRTVSEEVNMKAYNDNDNFRTIAAIERAGGSITCAYYDLHSVIALSDPLKFFRRGEPIPRR